MSVLKNTPSPSSLDPEPGSPTIIWHCIIAWTLQALETILHVQTAVFSRSKCLKGKAVMITGAWASFFMPSLHQHYSSSVLDWQSGLPKNLANGVTLCPYMLKKADRQDPWIHGSVFQLVFRIPYSLVLATSACNVSRLRGENLSIGHICGVSDWVLEYWSGRICGEHYTALNDQAAYRNGLIASASASSGLSNETIFPSSSLDHESFGHHAWNLQHS